MKSEAKLKSDIELIDSILSKKGAITRRSLTNIRELMIVELIKNDNDLLLNKPLCDCDLSIRLLNKLKSCNVDYISELVDIYPTIINDLGLKSKIELKTFMVANNLINKL